MNTPSTVSRVVGWLRLTVAVGSLTAASLLARAQPAAGAAATSDGGRDARPSQPAGLEAAIPFELSGNKIYVQVMVNEHGPYWFAVDTGSPPTLLDREVAKELGIKIRPRGKAGGAGEGSMPASWARGVKLALGGIQVRGDDVLVMPIDEELSPYDGRKIQGLVGNNTLTEHVVEIDYAHRVMRFYDPEAYSYTGTGTVVPVTVNGYTFVNASIVTPGKDGQQGETIRARCIFDTGARLGLGLTTPLVRAHHLIDQQNPPPMTTVGYGVGGPVRHVLGRMEALKIAGVTLEQPVVTLSQEKRGVFAGGMFEGVIGGEVLRRFTVILDYPHERVILEPNASFGEPFEFDMSGLWYAKEGMGFEDLVVKSIAPGSPGEAAGVKVGDVITRIDGRPTGMMTLDQVRALFRGDGEVRELEIRRGEEVVRVRMVLRRLV